MNRMALWLLGLAAGVFALGSSEVKRFERDAAKDIASLLQNKGSTRSPSVKVSATYPGLLSPAFGEVDTAAIVASGFSTEGLPLFTEPTRSKAGRIESLNLSLRDFTLRGLRVERLEATIPNCRFDLRFAQRKRKIRLSRSGLGTGRVEILLTDLEKFIPLKFVEILSCTAKVTRGRLTIEGDGKFLLLNGKFSVSGEIDWKGTQILLKSAKMMFDGKPMDPVSEEGLLQILNPVIDLDKDLGLYDAVQISEVSLQPDRIIATGKTKIPDLPSTDASAGAERLGTSRLKTEGRSF
jgi:hypothetical protein